MVVALFPQTISGAQSGYRRDHLRSLTQRVEVADDANRIMGIEDGAAKEAYCRPSAAIGGGWRAQKGFKVAGRDR